MSDADNQVGGTGEPFSKRDQGDPDETGADDGEKGHEVKQKPQPSD